MSNSGCFVVSLDFELYWGLRDHTPLSACRERLLGVRQAVPEMLKLFEQYEIEVTWAVVGFLFADGRESLMKALPESLPTYENEKLSPYSHLESLGDDEQSDPFHFAPSLISLIANTPGQEIATHTFSHFYCCESGATPEQLRYDLQAAKQISAQHGHACTSIVFPRNQYKESSLPTLQEMGIGAYRPSKQHWAYKPVASSEQHMARRGVRFADAYLPLTGEDVVSLAGPPTPPGLIAVPASRFFRPYSPRLRNLDPIRIWRITRDMTRAARSERLYHLWWHPHNFGTYLEENMALLEEVLQHFVTLKQSYGMQSATMHGAAQRAGQRSVREPS